jgi:CRISPR/Cas system-associated exonuclease Cas4 (RecB family)
MKYFLPYFSYSQLNTFIDCPHAFFLTYLSEERKRHSNKYTELGSLLHEIFELQGKQLIIESMPLTKGKANRMYNQGFLDINRKLFTDKEDFIKMYQKGITAIDNYYELFADRKPLFVEKKFQGAIAEGLPPAKSFVDRIEGDPEDASTWIISDYKTGSSAKSKDYLRTDLQMGLYASQVFATYGKYPKAVQFVHPVPNKIQTALHIGEGVYRFQGQREPVVEFSVSETITKVREVIIEIMKCHESGEFKKVPRSWDCKNCFHNIEGTCQPFLQNSGWEAVGRS